MQELLDICTLTHPPPPRSLQSLTLSLCPTLSFHSSIPLLTQQAKSSWPRAWVESMKIISSNPSDRTLVNMLRVLFGEVRNDKRIEKDCSSSLCPCNLWRSDTTQLCERDGGPWHIPHAVLDNPGLIAIYTISYSRVTFCQLHFSFLHRNRCASRCVSLTLICLS